VEQLREVLAERGADRILEFREFAERLSRDSEIDLSEFEPSYTSEGEGLWTTTPSLEWVTYASHESSLAVGGQWLVGEIKKRWPEWPQHIPTDGTTSDRPVVRAQEESPDGLAPRRSAQPALKQQALRAADENRYDEPVFGRPVSVLTKQLLYH
jgi:hypothetical protein